MLFGGYEHWMLRFWTLRKLDATLLDALIATRLIEQRQNWRSCRMVASRPYMVAYVFEYCKFKCRVGVPN